MSDLNRFCRFYYHIIYYFHKLFKIENECRLKYCKAGIYFVVPNKSEIEKLLTGFIFWNSASFLPYSVKAIIRNWEN